MYGLTGHTQGIGLAIYDKLKPNVLGFSRSNGFDITKKDNRCRIIDLVNDCSVFINNAHADYAQVDMLIELFHDWKDKQKIIINIGSQITDRKLSERGLYLLDYAAQKRALKSIIDDMQGYNCAVLYVQFGYVGTDRILTKYPNLTAHDYISVQSAVHAILDKIDQNAISVP